MSSKANTKKILIIVLAVVISMSRNTEADFTLGEPVNLGPPVNTSVTEIAGSISADGLSLYFSDGPWVLAPEGYGGGDLWVTTRSTKEDPWGEPMNLGPTVNTLAHESFAHLSADGSTLYWNSDRPGGYGEFDIWQVSIITLRNDVDVKSDLNSNIENIEKEVLSERIP